MSCFWRGEEYSEGAETCQNGVRKECVDGRWRSIGTCNETGLDVELRLEPIPKATAEQEAEIGEYEVDRPSEGQRITERYADESSLFEHFEWTYFKGGPTPGAVCTSSTGKHKVPTDDIIGRGRAVQCRGNPTIYYVKLTYRY